jgi:Zn-dependent protease with chaperone function
MKSSRIPLFITAFSLLVFIFTIIYLFPFQATRDFNSIEYPKRFFSPNIAVTEFDDLINRIKKDIKMPDIIVNVLVGPYFKTNGILVAIELFNAPKYYIIMDQEFLSELNTEEKRAAISHEMGHIVVGIGHTFDSRNNKIEIEKKADEFASKYVHPKYMKSLLEKAYRDYVERKENLNILINLKDTKQDTQ